MLDTRLQAFLATVQEGHLTGAARKLNLSVSALSHHISQLEQDFSAALFTRGNRGMVLTPAGESLYHYAVQIEGAWQQAYREVRARATGDQLIHLAASHTVTEFFLPEPLGLFRKARPEVRLHLRMVNSDEVASLVESGAVDLGISEGRRSHGSLSSLGLWNDELGCILSADHPLQVKPQLSLDDVVRQDLILREDGSGTRSIFEQMLEDHGVSSRDLRVTAELASIQGILGLVAHGVGIAVLSRVVTYGMREVVYRPIADVTLTRQISLLERPGPKPNQAILQLIDTMVRSATRFNQRRGSE
ncbi:MAG: LysR family transcriptional regulator [Sulfobacillus benefaciens]|uniref:LysR family transcriptional regulator n=1 Tax=Sulfobacillus benefaciens TaxID=453960 RepID=A0A2T2XEZ1_9FIRM|nr:MAG: LysR family transcriptional regulator [Sulfobacillus benefaciens]